MKKQIEQDLAEEITQSVERIVAASHSAAVMALDRAFNRGKQRSGRRGAGRPISNSEPRPATRRRTREEMAVLERRLHQVVCADPGQAMSVLAPRLEMSPRDLQVPTARLKASGLIRTVGQRQFTRYFPVGDVELAG